MNDIGHNSDNATGSELKRFIERIERLEDAVGLGREEGKSIFSRLERLKKTIGV